jgi:hypothetical protein
MTASGGSLVDWLSDEDHRFRAALEAVNLGVELNLTADEVRDAQSKFGLVAEKMLLAGWRPKDIIKKYPALTIAVLVGHAALAYDQGAYWDGFWKELGVYRDPTFESALRQNLVPLLTTFRLARFPDLENQNQYVMIFAMHSGIPVYCLRDLLKMIDERLQQGMEPNGTALLEWLEEPGKQYRSNNLDVPVRNFLRYGGEFAVDIVDRIIDVVDSAVADPSLLESGLHTETTGLPTILLERLIDDIRNRPPIWKGRRASGGRVQRRPELSYSVDDDQIFVSVPFPRKGPELPWRVSFDGAVQEIFPERGWGIADGEHPPTLVPVPEPVREILLWHEGSEVSFTLRVVSPSDPLLIFSPDGSWVPRRDALKDGVWVVHPSDADLYDPQNDRTISATGDSGSPLGWRGWVSSFVDLSTVSALQLRRRGHVIGTVRSVREDAPTFEFKEPLLGCRTAEGRTVYAERPMVILPPSSSNQPTVWRVRTRRVGATEWMSDEGWQSEENEAEADPFDDSDPGLLGLFEIIVSGPIGSDERAIVFLAEGLAVEFDTKLRIPSPAGLTPCTASIRSSTQMCASEDRIDFSGRDLEKIIHLNTVGSSAEILLHPPHIQIRAGGIGEHAPWRTTAGTSTPEELAEDRFVAVRVPAQMAVGFVFLDGAGAVVQVEQAQAKPGGVHQIYTAKFFDSAKSAAIGTVIARITGEGGVLEVPVLAIRPPQLCTGISLVDRSIEFSGLVDANDLAVYVWRATAPWLPAVSLPLDGARLPLPPELTECGDLLCQVFVDDPWVTIEAPSRPDAQAFQVKQSGWVQGKTSAQTHLSRFLAGEGAAPDSAVNAPEVWAALSWLGSKSSDTGAILTRSALMKMLAQQPRQALESLGNSTVPAREKVAMLIESELVNRSLSAEFTLNEHHADPWFGCMVEISDLPALEENRHAVAAERDETLAYLRDKGGEVLIDVLARGKDARPYEGCFDQSVYLMNSMSAGQVDEILADLRLVPGALLDIDTRVAATVEAFRCRDEWLKTGCSDVLAAQTSAAMNAIKHACTDAYDVIGARSDALAGVPVSEHPWMLMSLQSLTLAILARLEAHGIFSSQYLTGSVLSAWQKMAQLCPRLVGTDILIAEALVVHSANGDLTGDVCASAA